MDVDVRVCQGNDLAVLQERFPLLEVEPDSDVIALWDGPVPQAHLTLRWSGSVHLNVKHHLSNVFASTVAEIGRLRVHPDARRKGFARTLLNFAHKTAAENGFENVALSVGLDNRPAQELYKDLGYRPVGLEPFDSAHGQSDTGERYSHEVITLVCDTPALDRRFAEAIGF